MRQLSVKSKQTTKRKRPTAFWKQPTFRPMALSVVFGLMAALMTYAVKNGMAERAGRTFERAAVETTAQTGFILRDVLVEGRENTPIEDLRAVVNLKLDQPILDADPQTLRTRVEALPWVATAQVERQLPDIIHIRLNEHRPTAMWQHDGTFSLINKEGEVILTGGDDIGVFSHLPLVVGNGAPRHAGQILAILQSEPHLNDQVKAAVRVSDRRWDVVMNNGMTIRLPEDNPEKAWSRLAQYDADNALFEKRLVAIDMRLPDRILVKFNEMDTLIKPVREQNT